MSLDKEAIARFANSNSLHKVILDFFAEEKRRNREETDIPAMKKTLRKNGVGFDSEEFDDAIRMLANLGTGTVLQEGGKLAKVRWKYPLKDIGNAPLGVMLEEKSGFISRPAKTQPSNPVLHHGKTAPTPTPFNKPAEIVISSPNGSVVRLPADTPKEVITYIIANLDKQDK